MQKRASTSCARGLLFSLFALLLGALLRPATAQEVTSPRRFKLTGPGSSFLLVKEYPKHGLRLDFAVRYEKPGMVFDTVGLNAAPAGAWTVVIVPDGKLTVQVFDHGWHLLTSAQKLTAGQTHHIVLDFTGAAIVLRVNDVAQTLPLTTPLSGQPVWIGDFPGDDQWGPRYNIHPAFTGELTIMHFGAPSPPAGTINPPDAATTTGSTPSTPQDLPEPVVLARGQIGPDGGTIESKGAVSVVVPAGALARTEQIVVSSAPSTDGHFFQITRTGAGHFAQPVRVAFALPPGVDASQIVAVHEIAPGLARVVPANVDGGARTLSIEVRHFSLSGWLENFGSRNLIKVVGTTFGAFVGMGLVVKIFGAAAVATLTGMTMPMWIIIGTVAGIGYMVSDPLYDAYYRSGMSGPVGRPGPFEVFWNANTFATRPQVWEVSNRQSGTVLGYFSPDDFPSDPLLLQQTQGTQNATLTGVTGQYTWNELRFGRVPADILLVLGQLQYTRAWYSREGFTVPDRPMSVLVRPGDDSGAFDGRLLFLNPRGLIQGGEFADELWSAIGHEYFHAVARQNGYLDGQFLGREESMCVAFESLVFPGCDAFLKKDYNWPSIYSRLKNGLMGDGSGEENTTPARRGYWLWPWPKYLYHRYQSVALRDYATGTMPGPLLSQRFRGFAYSLLASDEALLDPIQVFDLGQRRMVSRTGWRDFSLTAMANSNPATAVAFDLGTSTLAPSCPLSLRAFKVNVPRLPGGPLVIRRQRPDANEEFVAPRPTNAGGTSLANTWTRANMVGLTGGGVIREKWTDSAAFSDLMGVAVIGTAAEYSTQEGDDTILIYRLNPPSNLKMTPSATPGATRLQWTLPNFGATLKPGDCLLGYRLFGRTKAGKEDLIGELYFDLPEASLLQLPGKLTMSIPAAQTGVELPAEITKPYVSLGLQSVEKVLRQDGKTVLSRIEWSFTPCTLAIEPSTFKGQPNKPYSFKATATFAPTDSRFAWTLNGQSLKSTGGAVTLTFPAPCAVTLVAKLLDSSGKTLCTATATGTIENPERPAPPPATPEPAATPAGPTKPPPATGTQSVEWYTGPATSSTGNAATIRLMVEFAPNTGGRCSGDIAGARFWGYVNNGQITARIDDKYIRTPITGTVTGTVTGNKASGSYKFDGGSNGTWTATVTPRWRN